MKRQLGLIKAAVLFSALSTTVAVAQSANSADAIDGRWDATVVGHGVAIPFRLDISGSGASLKGTLFDGSRPNNTTSSASLKDGKLVLVLEHYESTITAELKDGKLVGGISAAIANGVLPDVGTQFEAVRHVDTADEPKNVPSIDGSWIIILPSLSEKGEKAFRLIVNQNKAYVEATILRVDGDSGAYSGTFKEGKWLLSHYDGGRPGAIKITVQSDGSLKIVQLGGLATDDTPKDGFGGIARNLVAYRQSDAEAKGLPQPDNYQTHTGILNPKKKFTFKFPDADGKIVSSDDPQFKGKVLIVSITGTWCENCHDEAQFLVEMDKKYRDKGLQIVALDFEESEQLKTLKREHAFVKHYGVQFTYLIAGTPDQLNEKVPEAVNLNSWPTAFFIGRDGTIRATHTGFASPASGEFYGQLKKEFESTIEKLLAEPETSGAASL
jgi:thiol-disulfide isomerase/thioredoxin